MTQHKTAIAGLMMLGLCGANSAQAQYYFGPRDYAPQEYGPRYYEWAVPPYEVMRVVRSTGLTPVTRPMRRGATYVVVAANRSGEQMRIAIDAASGHIITINPMVAMRQYGAEPFHPSGTAPREDPSATYGMGPAPRYEGAPPPLPPRDVPSSPPATAPAPAAAPSLLDAPRTPRVATPRSVPPPTLASAPARTPLPRPRPHVAVSESPAESVQAPPVVPAAAPAAIAPAPAPAATASTLIPTPTAPAIINPAAPPTTYGTTQMVPVAPLE